MRSSVVGSGVHAAGGALMSARKRWRTLALAAVAGAAAVGMSGCASAPVVPGSAHTSECARWDLDPEHCSEFTPVRPVARDMLVGSDRATAARMMCSLLDDHTWQRLIGGPYYRYIDPTTSGACVVAAAAAPDQPRFSIVVSSFPQAMQGYSIVDGNERTTVNGRPAWRNVFNDAMGNRYTDYTVATGDDPNSGGVVFVKVRAELPRGVFEMAEPPLLPAYDKHAEIAETVINSMRSAA